MSVSQMVVFAKWHYGVILLTSRITADFIPLKLIILENGGFVNGCVQEGSKISHLEDFSVVTKEQNGPFS